jgi:hypothetical protein
MKVLPVILVVTAELFVIFDRAVVNLSTADRRSLILIKLEIKGFMK